MKLEWNKKYTTIAIYSFIVLALTVVFALSLIHMDSVWEFVKNILSKLSPIITGIIFAYLLNPILTFFETKVFKKVYKNKPYSKLRRALSITSVMITVAAVIYLIIIILYPQVAESYKSLIYSYDSVDDIITSIINYLKANEFFANNYEQVLSILGIDMTTGDSAIIEKLYTIIKEYTPAIITTVKDVAMGIYDVIVAFILSIYLLAFRERVLGICKKLMTSVFNSRNLEKITHIFSITNENFGVYIRGRLFDALIVFIICYATYGVMGLKFYPLLAFITGLTNIIPVFGPFVGAIPVAFIVAFTQPDKLFWALLAILIIQLLDGNFISPMILGDSFGLSSIWIISSTILFGELFGFFGMLLGVPVFATLYAIVREKTNDILASKQLSIRLADYYPEMGKNRVSNKKSKFRSNLMSLLDKIKSFFKKSKNKKSDE